MFGSQCNQRKSEGSLYAHQYNGSGPFHGQLDLCVVSYFTNPHENELMFGHERVLKEYPRNTQKSFTAYS